MPGKPVTQGSKRLIQGRRGPHLIEDAKGHAGWRRTVTQMAMVMGRGRSFQSDRDAVGVVLHFYFLSPKHPKRWFPPSDIDKLARGVLDGLKDAGLLTNDSQVKPLLLDKDYGPAPGVQVTLFPVRKGEGYAAAWSAAQSS